MSSSALETRILQEPGSGAQPPTGDLTARAGAGNSDFAMRILATAAAVSVLVMLAALVAVLAYAAIPSIKAYRTHFLVGSSWRPNELEVNQRDAKGHIVYDSDGDPVKVTIPPAFGALPVIYGTAVSSGLSLLFAIPLSFGAALFLVRVAPRIRMQMPTLDGKVRIVQLMAPVSFLIEFLAAIPSIAYGIWGIFVLTPFLQNHGEPWLRAIFGHIPGLRMMFYEQGAAIPLTGRDMFCGGMILAIMIVPIITAISRDVLRAVPIAQIEGTQALGATWWQSSWEMLRYSRSGLFGAIMLGLARAAGETMAVAMVIGNVNQIRSTLFVPAQTMSSLLANEFAEANSDIQRAALVEVALILLVMSLLFNVVARYLVVGRQSTPKRH